MFGFCPLFWVYRQFIWVLRLLDHGCPETRLSSSAVVTPVTAVRTTVLQNAWPVRVRLCGRLRVPTSDHACAVLSELCCGIVPCELIGEEEESIAELYTSVFLCVEKPHWALQCARQGDKTATGPIQGTIPFILSTLGVQGFFPFCLILCRVVSACEYRGSFAKLENVCAFKSPLRFICIWCPCYFNSFPSRSWTEKKSLALENLNTNRVPAVSLPVFAVRWKAQFI